MTDINGIVSISACDKLTYSDSKIESDMDVYSFDVQDIGNNVYITMYKYLEFTVLESISTVTLCQFPEKSMSVNTSNDLF